MESVTADGTCKRLEKRVSGKKKTPVLQALNREYTPDFQEKVSFSHFYNPGNRTIISHHLHDLLFVFGIALWGKGFFFRAQYHHKGGDDA